MSEFTQGNWKYMNDGTIRACPPNSYALINIIKLAGFKEFKEVLGEEKAREMIDANGRLIAASPEMYEMLKEELISTSDYGGILSFERERKVRELLARIDGEEK